MFGSGGLAVRALCPHTTAKCAATHGYLTAAAADGRLNDPDVFFFCLLNIYKTVSFFESSSIPLHVCAHTRACVCVLAWSSSFDHYASRPSPFHVRCSSLRDTFLSWVRYSVDVAVYQLWRDEKRRRRACCFSS